MYRGIIFDFDGVIVDTEADKFEYLVEVLAARGYSLQRRDFSSMAGKKTRHFLAQRFPTMPTRVMDLIVAERKRRVLSSAARLPLIPGLRPLLEYLAQRHVRVGLATGSERRLVNAVLKEHALDKHFCVLITGEDFTTSKPSPESYLLALKGLRLPARDVAAIEDSPAGTAAAQSAGCTAFAVTTTVGAAALRRADKTFKDHTGVLRFLKTLP